MTPQRKAYLATLDYKYDPNCVCSLCTEWRDGLLVEELRADELGGKSESQRRKETPIFSGVMRYFPDALAAVARVSKKGNDKHNPGEPLHWSREKSSDHGDCIARHQMTFDEIDPENGEYHAAAVAWRALAQLQLLEEARKQKVE